jgi:quinol monooxygenase YgiN
MIIIAGEAEIDAAKIDAALPHLTTMMQETRKEAGCISYSLLFDPSQPGVISICERWTDETSLKSHFTSPHMAAFNQALGGFGVKRLDVKMYDATNERDVRL